MRHLPSFATVRVFTLSQGVLITKIISKDSLVLSCPLRFQCKCSVRFVLTPNIVFRRGHVLFVYIYVYLCPVRQPFQTILVSLTITRQVPLAEQDFTTILEHPSSSRFLVGLVCSVFRLQRCILPTIICLFCPLCCLSFMELRLPLWYLDIFLVIPECKMVVYTAKLRGTNSNYSLIGNTVYCIYTMLDTSEN